jgi:hypothetical protein
LASSLRPLGKSGSKMKFVEWYGDGKPKVLGEIAVSVMHFSPNIPQGLACESTLQLRFLPQTEHGMLRLDRPVI